MIENNGSVTIEILLSQASLVQFEVEINTIDVTAIGNNCKWLGKMCNNICIVGIGDYDGMINTVTIPPGTLIQTFIINIFDNNLVECNETFIITMVSVTTCGVTIGNNNNSEVMIRDDDGKHRRFIIFCYNRKYDQ